MPDRGDVRPLIWLVIGVLASFVYLSAAPFSTLFTIALPLPFFPPEAVILSVLLLTRRRKWWIYLLAFYAMLVVEGIWSGLALPYNLGSNIANILEPLTGAALFRAFVPSPRLYGQLRDASIYVAAVTLGAVVGATWGASMRAIVGFPFWQSWPGWFLADLLASLILAPTIVLWASQGFGGLRLTSRARLVEVTLLGLAFVVVGLFVFSINLQNADAAPALLYLIVPLLVWSALRFGPQGLMTALAIVVAMAIAAVASNHGPYEGRSSPANVLSLQLYLLGVGVPLFLMSALLLEQRRTQRQLAQGEERYRVMVRSLPHDAVLLFDADLTLEFADGQALADLGLQKDAVVGRTLLDAFPDELGQALEPRYRSALAGEHVSVDLAHRERQFRMDVLPMPDVSDPTGMLVIHDVTEQKRAEFLAELDRAKTVFFGNISHELRTPLTLVLGPVEDALASGALSGPMLELVHRNVLRLQRLVNAVLDLSRIDAGHLTASTELTDVAALTADLASNFRSTVEGVGLRLIVDTPPLPASMQVYLDREMWETVVFNLISNAYKYTFEGEIRVTLRASPDERDIELEVRDTGIGIAADEQARVFERFHRVEGVQSRTMEGSGIGLALAHELVRLHGGALTVHSEEGRGSTFTVRLPVGTPGESADGFVPAPLRPSAHRIAATVEDLRAQRATRDAPPGQATSGRVLVVDDNPDMQRYVTGILSGDWIVETVPDGQSAMGALERTLPDILLLDVMMPGLSGFDVLTRIRTAEATRRLPVIMLTARAGEDAAVEALRAGANDYVTKPFAAAELSARVHTQVEAARARVEAEAAVEARDEFVSHVVHDLQHPLTAVSWHIQVLHRRIERGEKLTYAALRELSEAIEVSVKQLSTQINELRDATRLQAGRPLDLRLQSTDLVALARQAVEQQADSPAPHHIQFEAEAADLIGTWDRARLERVIENLLSNAIKFSPNGGAIAVRVRGEADRAVLSVEDHGLGIPAEDLARIFDSYNRGSNTSQIRGSGLGLSGAKHIVEQHGGSITVASTEGVGSTFTVRLPLARAE